MDGVIVSNYSFHSYDGDPDLSSLIQFAQRLTTSRLPDPAYYHAGDFVWQLYRDGASEDVGLWLDGEQIVACAIFEPPLNFQFDIDPARLDQRDLAAAIIAWAERRRVLIGRQEDLPIAYEMLGKDTLSTAALDADTTRIDWLADHGYARIDRHSIRYMQSLEHAIAEPTLPAGARVRHTADGELADRVELHRDAWSVWGPSSFDLDSYKRLRASPLYNPEMDIVVEYNGKLVSYCICWCDAATGVGYFEPVGTRPSAASRGFGRAVIHEGLRRMRERGLTTAIVSTASVNKPAQALYTSAGFSESGHERFYVKQVM